MKEATYYNLMKEYENLINQKQFNQYFGENKRLDKVKKTLLRQLKKTIINIACDVVDEEKGRIPKNNQRGEKFQQLKNLYSKIGKEEPIVTTDYEDTFNKKIFLFGFTINQLLPVILLAAAYAIFYKLLVN